MSGICDVRVRVRIAGRVRGVADCPRCGVWWPLKLQNHCGSSLSIKRLLPHFSGPCRPYIIHEDMKINPSNKKLHMCARDMITLVSQCFFFFSTLTLQDGGGGHKVLEGWKIKQLDVDVSPSAFSYHNKRITR